MVKPAGQQVTCPIDHQVVGMVKPAGQQVTKPPTLTTRYIRLLMVTPVLRVVPCSDYSPLLASYLLNKYAIYNLATLSLSLPLPCVDFMVLPWGMYQ